MNKIMIACGLCLAALSGCGPENTSPGDNTTAMPGSYIFEVTEDASFSKNLPDLQSFVWGSYGDYWIMFSGRRNGFHGFNTSDTGSGNFPVKKANDQIFVYNTSTHTIDSVGIPGYGGDTANVFRSTNLPHTQRDNYLYACGGYGVANATDKFASVTYDYFMKIDMQKLVAAVQSHSADAVKNAIKWGKSDLVKNTGGELYLLDDNNFYLCVGHSFTGKYGDTTAVQVYQDKVNVFSVAETGNQLTLNSVATLTDNLPDSTTQFRRRDLVVAPAVQPNGTDIGIAIFGGVFTYTSGAPISNNGVNFTHPIYIANSSQYKIETAANQYANIYSAAFLCMYDSSSKRMMTTFFGGLGDKTNEIDSSANWTNKITTAERSYQNGTDVTFFNSDNPTLPGYIGAESVFIPKSGVPFYNTTFNILNYDLLQPVQDVGYIYGGIRSSDANGDSTSCSNVVYKVTFKRLVPVAAN